MTLLRLFPSLASRAHPLRLPLPRRAVEGELDGDIGSIGAGLRARPDATPTPATPTEGQAPAPALPRRMFPDAMTTSGQVSVPARLCLCGVL
jgi:hypothetical protein